MTAFTVSHLVLESRATFVGGDSTYFVSTCFPVLGEMAGLGARHSHVHFRNLQVPLLCEAERRSRGVRRNTTRVLDKVQGRSGSVSSCMSSLKKCVS
jgi:hypothetical protein